MSEVTNPALAVVRLHGRNEETWSAKGPAVSSERFNDGYSGEEIDPLAEQIDGLLEPANQVQGLVNVNHGDQGVRAVRWLKRQLQALKERGIPT